MKKRRSSGGADTNRKRAAMKRSTAKRFSSTVRASAATDSADRQRHATGSRRQNATESRNAQLSVVSCEPLLGGSHTCHYLIARA